MRWFAAIYPRDDGLRACLDALIFLANPAEKDSAHITIRGPLNARPDVDKLSGAVRGTRISVIGAGHFFEDNQNTVFLRCDNAIIRKLWNKPDYPYNPHLTIYDGQSRSVAERVFELLHRNRPYFELIADECRLIESSPGQKSFHLWFGLDAGRIFEMTGDRFDADSIPKMEEWRRFMYMERICPRLNLLGRQPMGAGLLDPTVDGRSKRRSHEKRLRRRAYPAE